MILPDDRSTPFGLTTGPDGALWCTDNALNQIVRIAVPLPEVPRTAVVPLPRPRPHPR